MKILWLLQNVSLPRRTYGTIRLSRCAAGKKQGFIGFWQTLKRPLSLSSNQAYFSFNIQLNSLLPRRVLSSQSISFNDRYAFNVDNITDCFADHIGSREGVLTYTVKKAKITPSLDLVITYRSVLILQGNGFRLATSYISAMSII